MAAGSEDELIAWVRRRFRDAGALIGDDAAILPAGKWALTTDTQIEGTHFHSGLDPATVARRLLAVNLSDLAAMGAVPKFALLALAAPPAFDHRRFFDALARAVDRHGVALAGGDLARSENVHASMTLIGERSPGGRWVERCGARPGHGLWLGGPVGESALGAVFVARGARLRGRRVVLPEPLEKNLARRAATAARRAVRRHLLPEPQLELGSFLSHAPAGAAIDVSDGVARDLHRLCRESGVGAEVDLDHLPAAPLFHDLCEHVGRDPAQLQLAGGEDYVLLFTLPENCEPPPRTAHRIGRVIKARKVFGIASGERDELPPDGWDHLRA